MTKSKILDWWNALDATAKADAAKSIDYAGNLDDITITQVVAIYNELDEAIEPAKPGYFAVKDGEVEWAPDFEESIGE